MINKILLIAAVLLVVSCGTTKNVVYMQDVELNKNFAVSAGEYITVKPQDMLSIIVSSKDPVLAALFNLPRVQQLVGSGGNLTGSQSQVSGYTIDSKGNIDFPVVGAISIEGLTREQVAEKIKSTLIGQDLIKDPVVTVDFMNLGFSVMGEVARPGRVAIEKDQINVLEALSMAGDLTIYGKRDKVYLTRQTGTERITYLLDLRSVDVYNSPAFYVRQNDIIYVEPNNVRANQSTVNGNNVRSVSLWMSIASLLTTLGVLIFK